MNPHRKVPRLSGFTLLEILVVVVIIVIFTSVVALSVRTVGMERKLKEEALRLTSLLELASDEAVLSGRDLGLRVEPEGYRFLLFDYPSGSWYPLDADRVLRPRPFPEQTVTELYLEGLRIDLSEGMIGDDGQLLETPLPQILILSSGELTPFTLRLNHEQSAVPFDVVGSADGDVEVRSDEDDET